MHADAVPAERYRIALVGPLPPPSGGMASQLQQLHAFLGGDGHAVELVQTNAPYRPAWIGGLRGVRAAARLLPYLLALWRAAGRCQLMHVLANSGWAWRLFAVPAIRIARARGVPVIVNYHGGGAEAFFRRAGEADLAHLRAADAVVVPSDYLREVFARFGVDAVVVPNVIDTERFRPRPESREAGLFHVVVTRNLEPVYDNATALAAFALAAPRLGACLLTIAGSGPERTRLEALAGELGVADRVRFTGRIDNAAMPALYQGASVMVNPSRVDNQPVSILEAFACGVPVVSTNVGGVPRVAEDGRTALLVPAGEPQAMADALVRLANEDGLAARLAEAGLAESRRYTWPVARRAWLEQYRRVATGCDVAGGMRPDSRSP